MPVNFFGDEVELPVRPALKVPKEPKAIRVWSGNPNGLRQDQMTPEDKRLYARESKKAQLRREADEEARKDILKASQDRVDFEADYGSRQLEECIVEPPHKQAQAVLDQENILVGKILEEVGKDKHTDRIDGETIHGVVVLAYGIPAGYIDPNPAGLFCVGHFVDLCMCNAIDRVQSPRPGRIIRYDRPWQTSKSFLDAYRTALHASLNLCLKYPQLTEKHLVTKIQNEWTRVCEQ